MTTTTAIPSGTAAATAAADITVASGDTIQVWTSAELMVDEKVTVHRVDSGDSFEVVVRDQGGSAVQLSPQAPSVALIGPAIFRLKKTATVSSVAVLYDS